jgi:hypothetical protein
MKIPFNIKYKRNIQQGIVRLETEYGNPVRILCWDKLGSYPIVGLYEYYEDECLFEDAEYWDEEGNSSGGVDGMNLCIITP